MSGKQPFVLTEEHIRLIGDVLKGCGIATKGKAESLGRSAERSIISYEQAAEKRLTFRNMHDDATALWAMANETDPQIEVIRARIKKLPDLVLRHLEERGQRLWQRVYKQPYPECGFVQWSQTALWPEVLDALNCLLADGGAVVSGRSRAGGKRSAAKLQPSIMGVVRGKGSMLAAGHSLPGNGRPRADAEDDLVLQLASVWIEQTGLEASFAQTHTSGFPALVHQVFSWLELANANAALRRLGENTKPLPPVTEWHD